LLSQERLEVAEAVRDISVGPRGLNQLEVVAEVVQVPLDLWLVQRMFGFSQLCDHLLNGQRATAGGKNLVDGVQDGIGVFHQGALAAFFSQSLPDRHAKCLRDRRWECVADLPVLRCLPAEELPLLELLAVPALDACNHLYGQHWVFDTLHPWVGRTGRIVRYTLAVDPHGLPGSLGASWA